MTKTDIGFDFDATAQNKKLSDQVQKVHLGKSKPVVLRPSIGKTTFQIKEILFLVQMLHNRSRLFLKSESFILDEGTKAPLVEYQ